MKVYKKWVAIVISSMLLMFVTVSPTFAKSSDSTTSEQTKIQQIINKAKNSDYTTTGLSSSDIQLLIEKGGKEGQQTVDQLLKHAKPIDGGVDESELNKTPSNKKYSYSHTVGTSTETYVDDSQFSDEPENPTQTINGSNSPEAYPNDWYEQSPQSYSNTRSTCKLLISTNKGNFVGSGFLLKD